MRADLARGTATFAGVKLRLRRIENVVGSAADDVLRGSDRVERLFGEGGDDRLEGRGGDDRLEGGSGDDAADGGPGDDKCDAETEQRCEA